MKVMTQRQLDTSSPQICIIVSTYNRGPTLRRVLRTVIAQTETNWQLIVIGDACSDDTVSQIASLNDHRIQFINLPERFGEQAGPNSVGAALAQTPYVAFLNHDDYWLPEHLELAVKKLKETGADFFWSRAAFFTNRGAWADRLFFDDVSPKERKLEDLYNKSFLLAEPMSSWVVRRDALERLGPMKLASETQQKPIVEYCHRACQYGLTLATGDDITVLKDRVWKIPPTYDNHCEYAEPMVVQIESRKTQELSLKIEQDLYISFALGMNKSHPNPLGSVGQSSYATVDRLTG